MDFIDWCDTILDTCIKTNQTFVLNEYSLAQTLSTNLNIPDYNRATGLYTSTFHQAILNAMGALKSVGLVESPSQSKFLWNISKLGRDYIADKTSFWWKICQENLEPEYEHILKVVNKLSQQTSENYAYLTTVNHEALVSELEDPQILHRLLPLAHELEQWGFVSGWFSAADTANLQATYKGLVWGTRRGFTVEAKLIDDLVSEWETTSVDFKRQLSLDTMDQKAEFIKDILSLANTKASGRRWLIIGFDDKTRTYLNPPDPKVTQDRIERIVAQYVEPYLDTRYDVVEYHTGHVGKLEIIRTPEKLPYRVKTQMNRSERKPPLMAGEIFVRHGSQIEKPSDKELLALQEEGDVARAIKAEK